MVLPLMPKATAVWLIENTTLTFDQVGEFCGMHPLEVQGIADDEVAIGIKGADPVVTGQISWDNIHACEKDPKARLELAAEARKYLTKKTKGARYTPVARRADKPDAISWIIKNYPAIPDAQIVKLIGTTKNTINTVRSKAHWNNANIKPKDPVLLGLCSQTHLDEVIARYQKSSEKTA